tara:strand:+ start:431 stop:784 length:354 start_codon:yes stop_codon:yes gene_type:complete
MSLRPTFTATRAGEEFDEPLDTGWGDIPASSWEDAEPSTSGRQTGLVRKVVVQSSGEDYFDDMAPVIKKPLSYTVSVPGRATSPPGQEARERVSSSFAFDVSEEDVCLTRKIVLRFI